MIKGDLSKECKASVTTIIQLIQYTTLIEKRTKKHMIISVVTEEKASEKSQHPPLRDTKAHQTRNKGTVPILTKNIHKSPQLTSHLMVKACMFPPKSRNKTGCPLSPLPSALAAGLGLPRAIRQKEEMKSKAPRLERRT